MARKTDNYRYAIIPAGAITDARVEPRALQVLCLLGRHANDNGWCRRSQVKMAEELSCGRTTINRAIDLLVETGYVERREEGRGNAKPQPGKQPFAAYSYRVRLDRSDKEIQEVVEGGVDGRTPDGGCQPVDTGVSPQMDTGVSTSRTPLTEHTPLKHAPVEKEDAAPPPGGGGLFGDDPPPVLTKAQIIDQAFMAYDEAATRNEWGQCQARTEARQKKLGKRLDDAGGLEGWGTALEKAEASDFCMGRAPPRPGQPPFRVDIDFLLQQSSFVKLMEGKYDNRTGNAGAEGGGGFLAAAARRAAAHID